MALSKLLKTKDLVFGLSALNYLGGRNCKGMFLMADYQHLPTEKHNHWYKQLEGLAIMQLISLNKKIQIRDYKSTTEM